VEVGEASAERRESQSGAGGTGRMGMGACGQSEGLTIFLAAAGHHATQHTVACLQRFPALVGCKARLATAVTRGGRRVEGRGGAWRVSASSEKDGGFTGLHGTARHCTGSGAGGSDSKGVHMRGGVLELPAHQAAASSPIGGA
jgi:hypothetical protein